MARAMTYMGGAQQKGRTGQAQTGDNRPAIYSFAHPTSIILSGNGTQGWGAFPQIKQDLSFQTSRILSKPKSSTENPPLAPTSTKGNMSWPVSSSSSPYHLPPYSGHSSSEGLLFPHTSKSADMSPPLTCNQHYQPISWARPTSLSLFLPFPLHSMYHCH